MSLFGCYQDFLQSLLRKDMTDTLQRKYNALYKDYMALKYSDICVSCQKEKDSTPAGETFTLCHCCGEGKKKTLKSWKRCGKRQDVGKTVTKLFYNDMNKVVMVPAEELNRLSNYYQNKITESALLNKAG